MDEIDGRHTSSGTRMRAPHRHLLHRPRLDQAASSLLNGEVRCVTVWGGAGTGKTTLLDRWAHVFAAAGTTVTRLAGGELPDRLGDLIDGDPGGHVIVIDDLHLASTGQADALFRWLENTSAARVVAAGRYQPGAGVTHLAALGQILELRTRDLAFTEDECAELVAAHGLELTPTMIASLNTRTGGWATGLALAIPLISASSDPDASIERFIGDNRAIGDYLMTEVLDVCTPRERHLLLATAIDNRVPLELVAELGDAADTGTVLTALADRHQLLTVTADEVVFHPALGTFLQAETRRQNATDVRRLHEIAARWFARNGRGDDALRHATRSGDATLHREIFGLFAVDLILIGHSALVLDAIRSIPEPERSLPEHTAQLLISIPFTDRFRTSRLFDLADDAAAGATEVQWPTLLTALHVLAATATAETDPWLESLTSPSGRLARHTCYGLNLICAAAEGRAKLLAGNPRGAIDRFDGVADSSHNAGYSWLALQVSIFATDAAVVEGEWEEAAEIEDTMVERAKARSLADRARSAATVVTAGRQYQRCLPLPQDELSLIVRTDSARGTLGLRTPARALQLLEDIDNSGPRDGADELEDLLRASGRGYPRLVAAALLRLTSIRIELDGKPAARDFAQFAESVIGAETLEMQLAHYLLDTSTQAEQRLLSAAGARPKSWHAGAMVGAWILLASHAKQSGRHLEAERRVTTATAHAKRYRAIRPFRARNNEGATLVEAQFGHLGHLEDFGHLVVERARGNAPARTGPLPVVRLTSREHDILKELPLHQSLSEIARRQHLSANTVKTHVRAIYQKLGVAERSAAVTVARDLGLL